MPTTDELAEEILRCKNDVYSVIRELKADVESGNVKRDKMDLKLDNIISEFKAHKDEEVEGMKDMNSTLKELTITVKELLEEHKTLRDATDDNTDFIEKLKKYWVRITLIGTGVGGTLFAIYTAYTFLQKNGFVVVIESIGGK